MPRDSAIRKAVFYTLSAGIIVGCAGWIGKATAADLAASSNKKALQELEDNFASKIGGSLSEAELYLTGAGKIELAERKAKTVLPDNEPLLFHIILGKNQVSTTQDVYSIKQNHRLLLSLSDFASATGLAITAKPSEGTAKGWFIRQTNTFVLDARKNRVVIAGETAKVDPLDIKVDENDILVSSTLLEKWFGIDFSYDFANLSIDVKTTKPFPVEEAYLRGRKKRSQSYGDTAATLPYQEQPYALLSLPYIDTNINTRWLHTPGNAPLKTTTWSTILEGDVAGLSGQAFLGGTEQQPYLDNARFTFGKQDPEASLLGPLHATAYSFGDVNTLTQPIIGSGGQEQGVSVTNRSLDSLTNDTTTEIHGDAQPGWDVELYRNNSFIDIRHVDETGRYDFGKVDLVVGDNDFKFLFYGPQGEVKEEHKHVGVDPRTLTDGKGHYALSVSRHGLTTWQRERPVAPGTGDPHIAANYEYGLGDIGTGNIGIDANSYDGTYRTLAQTGLASYAFGTFFNADLGYDTSNGAFGGTMTARRTFDGQSALLQYAMNSPEFNPSSSFEGASLKESYRASLSGPVPLNLSLFDNTNYNLSGTFNNLYSGGSQLILSSGLTTRLESILLSTGSQYSLIESGSGATNESASGRVDVRGFAYGGSWRAAANYQSIPETRFTGAELEYNRAIGEKLDMTSQLEYLADPSFVKGSLGLNWQTKMANISPSIQVDSDRNVTGALNVHFAAAADPLSNRYDVYNRYLTGTGGVAARIFMDKNGSGTFDEGDELLPDVQIQALQSQRSALSDKNGIAFIPDLEQNRLTDVIVNPASSEDLYGISLFNGVSIRPHPGAVTKLEFPIVEGGEMDGQADFAGENGAHKAARGVQISLVAPDGRIEKSAGVASDGYWSISSVRPGAYYLIAEPRDGIGYAVPRLIEFKPDGSTLFGQSVVIKPYNVAFRFTSENPPPDGPLHARVIRASDVISQHSLVELGKFHSRLSMTLAWYKLKIARSPVLASFDLATPLSQITPDPKTGAMAVVLKPRKAMSMEQAAGACQKMQESKVNCTVHVVTTYRGTVPPPEKPLPARVAAKQAAKDSSVRQAAAAQASENEPVAPQPAPETVASINEHAAPPAANATHRKIVVMNLGSYRSRVLMSVMWYKFRTRYTTALADAKLVPQFPDSLSPEKTEQHVLRVATPNLDEQAAAGRCALLVKQGQACTVEVLPALEELSSARVSPKG